MGGRSGLRSASASDPSALLRLVRPPNGLIAAGAVLVGAVVARRPPEPWPAVLGAAAAFAAVSGANALNDVLDRRADAVNRPERPVASGAVGVRAALAVALAGYAAAVACACGISRQAGALAVAWVVLTALYSIALKGAAVASNALVAIVAASPLVMGGISQGRAGSSVVPLVLAFLAHFAREIVKDVQDLPGDEAAGVRTTAVALGAPAAVALARVVVVSLIGAAAVPFAAGLFGWGYAAAVVAIDVLLVGVLASTARPADRAGLGRASSLLKWVMVLGLLAFILGVI